MTYPPEIQAVIDKAVSGELEMPRRKQVKERVGAKERHPKPIPTFQRWSTKKHEPEQDADGFRGPFRYIGRSGAPRAPRVRPRTTSERS